ncbi:hypothetical protein [Nocardia amamiensis]|uniref:hypothetical protein n=1 Tax=Nocardia amamiensis TaxID=404578 RepID=UPI0034072FAB
MNDQAGEDVRRHQQMHVVARPTESVVNQRPGQLSNVTQSVMPGRTAVNAGLEFNIDYEEVDEEGNPLSAERTLS